MGPEARRESGRAPLEGRLGWAKRAAVAAAIASAVAAGPAGGGSAAAEAASAVAVELMDRAEVCGNAIRLGDVARLAEGDQQEWQRLSAIELGPAPLPGDARSLSRPQIELRLRQARVTPREVQWRGPQERVEVRACGAAVSYADIRRHLDEYLRGAGGGPAAGVSGIRSGSAGGGPLQVADLEEGPPVVMPPGPIAIEVVSAPPVLKPGPAVFAVELRHPSGFARRVWIRATLQAAGWPGGAALSRAPVGDTLQAPVMLRPAGAPGPGGQAVPRGASVVVVARRGAVEVSAPGVLVEGGRVGDVVPVVNAASGATIMAVLLSPDRAEAIGLDSGS